jgi:hypothetical protein
MANSLLEGIILMDQILLETMTPMGSEKRPAPEAANAG